VPERAGPHRTPTDELPMRPMIFLFFMMFSAIAFVGCSAESSEVDAVAEAVRPDPPQPVGNWEWLQSFADDTEHWYTHRDGTIHREPSGFESGGYASGISSSTGDFHARLRNPQGEGCVPEFSEETRCGGPYTPWGRPPVPNPNWPEGGYYTRIDIYLDFEWAALNPDRRFDFSSAINRAGDGAHLHDFLFNVGTNPDGSGSWIMNTSLRHARENVQPSNPCPDPSDGRNTCRTPATVDEGSGWYTFKHTFRDDQGDLAVDMQVIAPSGAVVAEWTIFDIPMEGVGGEHYGWFPNQEIFDLAIDNAGKYMSARGATDGVE